MSVRFVRPVSSSAYAARRLGLAALVLFALAALAHRFGPLSSPDFIAIVFLSAAIGAAAVPLAVLGLIRLWQVGADGGVAATKALIYAAVPLGTLATGAIFYITLPPLFDISTDIANPPSWISQSEAPQQWLPRPIMVTPADRAAQIAAYPAVTGRRYEGALDRVYQGVRDAAAASRIRVSHREGMQLVEPDITERPAPEDDQAAVPDVAPIPRSRPEPQLTGPLFNAGDVLLQGEHRTLILGLHFDVVIRLREDAETTSVDVRVASRYGAHDLGFGAAIAEDFLDRLDTALLGISRN